MPRKKGDSDRTPHLSEARIIPVEEGRRTTPPDQDHIDDLLDAAGMSPQYQSLTSRFRNGDWRVNRDLLSDDVREADNS